MDWFSGDVTAAIQKTIAEKKVFLVFIYDNGEQSKSLDELWQNEEVAKICSPEKCISIKLEVGSIGGQQFASIYPIVSTPCTYLISSDGVPSEIIQGCPEISEYITKLKTGVDKTLASTNPRNETAVVDGDVTSQNTNNSHSTVTSSEQLAMESSPSLIDNDKGSATAQTTDISASDKKEKAEALLEKSRNLRAQKDKEKEKDSERKRRQEGIELTRARKDLAERQARNLSQEIAKQRAEERAAREKVRQQIKQDRAEKAARHEKEKQERQKQAEASKEITSPPQPKVSKSSTSRIQFKLPDGSTHTSQFDADDKFHVVLSAAEECVRHLGLPVIRLTTVFPRHEFNVEDNIKSLRELNLVPTASIIISRGASKTSSAVSSQQWNPLSFVFLLLSPIISIFQWFLSLFSTSTPTRQSNETARQSPDESSTSSSSTPSSNVRRRIPGASGSSNIRQLRHDDESDNENGTWNGNSTQQM